MKMTLKKLVMCVGTLVCVLAVNAASVDWKINATKDQLGYQLFIVSAIDEAWTGVSDIAAASAALGQGGSGTIIAGSRNQYYSTSTIYGDNVTAESAAGFYWVIVSGADATTYNYVAADMSSYAYAAPMPSPGLFMKLKAADILAGTQGTFAGVPEPASGLLALLGFAGLALRRRRA